MVWALNRRLPDWAVYVSIFFDVSLLMVLIWSFHIQYGQPPSFYLKSPTLLYIFIFIGLRALRFRARFVAAAGVMAALGWLVMIGYVVFSNPEDTMITRNYISYMTSNSILLGSGIRQDNLDTHGFGGARPCSVSRPSPADTGDQRTGRGTGSVALFRCVGRNPDQEHRPSDRGRRRRDAQCRHPQCRHPRIYRHGGHHARRRRHGDPDRIPAPPCPGHSGQRRNHRQVPRRRHHGDLRRERGQRKLCRRCPHRGRCDRRNMRGMAAGTDRRRHRTASDQHLRCRRPDRLWRGRR